ncbi:sigma factor-like helix-turn-helix DNA-binding protein [Geomicrobium sp. JCM 19037]|uniref:sigma factor-like helix-turn-helix DNA-binding protein n=1 Tax=Geomicrobium sp. JCM 19037 TaxID=1460634 RepID=UPI000693CED7|nr:sigma factor-like helix-turn-helix DNA-binding protein [Geomicrobium sp. JCM 19037]
MLGDYHALQLRKASGDYAACDILIDLETAIARAQLSPRQAEALHYVYLRDLTLVDAGAKMGANYRRVHDFTEGAVRKIAEVYYYWSGHGEGYYEGEAV